MTTTPEMPADHGERYALEMARSRQSLPLAAVAGSAASALMAVAWAGITAATGYQLGLMAIAVGVAVGLAVRAAGRGFDPSFQLLAALLALVGCAVGNLLAGCVFYAQGQQVELLRVLEVLDVELALFIMEAMFSPMDLLFYGFAVWEAWRLAVLAPVAAEVTPTVPPASD